MSRETCDGAKKGLRAPDPGRRGFTLVEVMVAMALMAMLVGTIVSGSGLMSGNRLRSAAGLVVTGVRIAITRANTTGHPVRLVFDMEQQRLLLEETSDRMLRVKESDKKTSEGSAAGADPATEAEKESLKYADEIVKGPRAPRARFTAVPLGANETDPGKGRDFGRGIKYREVQTEHDMKPKREGRAYLYFWPGGGTERAVIQIQRGDDKEDTLSILVNPLTGRAKIQRGRVSFEAPQDDDDFGQREAER